MATVKINYAIFAYTRDSTFMNTFTTKMGVKNMGIGSFELAILIYFVFL